MKSAKLTNFIARSVSFTRIQLRPNSLSLVIASRPYRSLSVLKICVSVVRFIANPYASEIGGPTFLFCHTAEPNRLLTPVRFPQR
jgi:hypothetical protein